jgi:Ohr subfamily peroxiredoxin
MVNVIYKTTVTATGGREGRVKSADGALDLALIMPKEMGGPGGKGANPETLFAAGYAACFESAMRFLAMQEKKPLSKASVTATVGVGPREAGGFGLTVELSVKAEGQPRADIERLANSAHQAMCPYSHATRGNVDVKVRVE